MLVSAFLMAFHLANRFDDADFFQAVFSIQISIISLVYIYIMTITWYVLFKVFNLYGSRRMGTLINEWKDIFLAVGIFCALFFFSAHILRLPFLSPAFMVIFWICGLAFSIVARTLIRIFIKNLRIRGRNLRFALIIGSNQKTIDFSRTIEEKKSLGYRVLGFLDNEKHVPDADINLLGSLDDFPGIVANNVVDEIFIGITIKSYYDAIRQIIMKAEEQGILIRFISQAFETCLGRVRTEHLENFTVTTISPTHYGEKKYLVKRILDVIVGGMALLVFSPLLILAGFLIFLTSPGPVLFVQDRVGYNKRVFKLYKFRTMVRDAEKQIHSLENKNEMDGPVFKIKNDPRITKIGKILRATSIDELPQLINVIRGDMSLVGPRPLPIRDYNGFNEDWQKRRFSVLPGITCKWQISGRNNISFDEWMRLDMDYIDNWSLKEDIFILLKTIPAVFSRKGAS